MYHCGSFDEKPFCLVVIVAGAFGATGSLQMGVMGDLEKSVIFTNCFDPALAVG